MTGPWLARGLTVLGAVRGCVHSPLGDQTCAVEKAQKSQVGPHPLLLWSLGSGWGQADSRTCRRAFWFNLFGWSLAELILQNDFLF